MSKFVQQPLMINLKLSQQEINFLKIATKMTVLSTTMAISTFSLITLALISTYYSNQMLGGLVWNFGVRLGIIIDSVTSVISIYLSLPYDSSRLCYRICCQATCHKWCYKCAKQRLQGKKVNKLINTQMTVM